MATIYSFGGDYDSPDAPWNEHDPETKTISVDVSVELRCSTTDAEWLRMSLAALRDLYGWDLCGLWYEEEAGLHVAYATLSQRQDVEVRIDSEGDYDPSELPDCVSTPHADGWELTDVEVE